MPEPLRWDMILPNGEPLRYDMGPDFRWDGNVPEHLYPQTPMQQNDLSITITNPAETAILDKADELIALIDAFAVSLTDEERRRLFKLGDERLAFDQKSDNYIHQRPDLVPAHLNVPEYDKDGAALAAVKRMEAKLATVNTRLSDTRIVLGSDRMDANMLFFHYTDFLSRTGVAGADDVHDDLSASYPSGRRRPPTPPTP